MKQQRLTKRTDGDKAKPCFCEPKHAEEYSTKSKRDAVNKLGKLEDIEEELGVDFVTLCKAFEEDIWIKWDGMIFFVPYDQKQFVFYEGNIYCELKEEKCGYVVSIDDYGKTWALTREELEEKE